MRSEIPEEGVVSPPRGVFLVVSHFISRDKRQFCYLIVSGIRSLMNVP